MLFSSTPDKTVYLVVAFLARALSIFAKGVTASDYYRLQNLLNTDSANVKSSSTTVKMLSNQVLSLYQSKSSLQ